MIKESVFQTTYSSGNFSPAVLKFYKKIHENGGTFFLGTDAQTVKETVTYSEAALINVSKIRQYPNVY